EPVRLGVPVDLPQGESEIGEMRSSVELLFQDLCRYPVFVLFGAALDQLQKVGRPLLQEEPVPDGAQINHTEFPFLERLVYRGRFLMTIGKLQSDKFLRNISYFRGPVVVPGEEQCIAVQ